MNNLLKIFIWFLIVISTSCAISKKENERFNKLLSQQSKEIMIPKADSVTTEMLRKFEVRATQKLEDFYDYLELLGSNNYSESMKNEIKISAHGLFYHANSTVVLFDETSEEPRSVEEALILQEDLSTEEQITVSDIELIKPLSYAGKEMFVGQISFHLSIGKEENVKSIEKYAYFSLRKIEKSIGTDQVKIWEIFLESIE